MAIVVKNCEINNQPSLWGSVVKSLGTTRGCATLFDWAGKVSKLVAESGKAWAPMKAVGEMSSTGLSGLEFPYLVYILDASVGSATRLINGNFGFKAVSEFIANSTDAVASMVGVVDRILPGVVPGALVNMSEMLETTSKVADLGLQGHTWAKNRAYIRHFSDDNRVDWETSPILAKPVRQQYLGGISGMSNIGMREDYTSPALQGGVEAQNTNIVLKIAKTILNLAMKVLKAFNVQALSGRTRAAICALAASFGLAAELRANYGTFSNLKLDFAPAGALAV